MGTGCVAHRSRVLIQRCRRRKTTGAILFLEVKQAFEVVLQLLIFGVVEAQEAQDAVEAISSMPVPDDVKGVLRPFIERHPTTGLIGDLELDEEVVELLRQLHVGTWLVLIHRSRRWAPAVACGNAVGLGHCSSTSCTASSRRSFVATLSRSGSR